MQEEVMPPRTARDALVVELLSDLGRVHDDIKSIPSALKVSMADSLEIVAKAVEEAEQTAGKLSETTQEHIQQAGKTAAFNAGAELTSAIQASLQRTIEPSLQRAATQFNDLEGRIKALSGNVRDAHATRMNYIILISFALAMIVTIGFTSWIAVLSQQTNEANRWFYDEYIAQRAVIDSLPPDIKKKFKK